MYVNALNLLKDRVTGINILCMLKTIPHTYLRLHNKLYELPKLGILETTIVYEFNEEIVEESKDKLWDKGMCSRICIVLLIILFAYS